MAQLRIGLTISGAISLGAYEGGALAGLIAVLRRAGEAGAGQPRRGGRDHGRVGGVDDRGPRRAVAPHRRRPGEADARGVGDRAVAGQPRGRRTRRAALGGRGGGRGEAPPR